MRKSAVNNFWKKVIVKHFCQVVSLASAYESLSPVCTYVLQGNSGRMISIFGMKRSELEMDQYFLTFKKILVQWCSKGWHQTMGGLILEIGLRK